MRLLHARTVQPDPSAAINADAAQAAQKFLLSRVPGSRRRLGLTVSTIGVALGTSLLVALAPGVAQASPPVGTCTKSYTELTALHASGSGGSPWRARCRDVDTGEEGVVEARAVVNAAG